MSTRPLIDVQEHLTQICTEVAESHEPIIIEREGEPSVVLVPASSNRADQRVARIMGNPAYVRELQEAVSRVESGQVITMELEELQVMFKSDADRS